MEAPFPGCPELSAWHAHSLASQAPARRQALKRSSSGGDDDEAAKRARNRAEERLSWKIGNNGVPPHNHPHRDMYDNLRALS